ncbi:hypothetical protein FRC11_010554 [Ceratobasidium sp. 423]|nr:hypothetical protein FRC11_010554 [Ceratobasidium sp. 423]
MQAQAPPSPTDTVSSGFSHLSFEVDDASSASCTSSSHSVSKAEATFYYAGISPTPPKLVYRTGSVARPFVMPKDPEAYRQLKEARGVYGHKLNLVWGTAGPKVCDLLDAQQLAWTTVDCVRFLTLPADEDEGKPTVGPVVIWIGVRPGSLESEDAFNAANGILRILKEFNIDDVEVEFRESLYHRSAGPALLKSVSNLHNTVDVRGPLTTALGLSISTAARPNAQGTMTVFFAEGGDSTKTLGLTCRHVVLEVDAMHNDDYTFAGAGAPHRNVLLLGKHAFDALLASIRLRIGRHGIMLRILEGDVERLESRVEGDDEDDVAEAKKELKKVRAQLEEANKAIVDLEEFYATVKSDWGSPKQRVIGHIRRSPPILFGVQPGGFTQDWAAIELDGPKFREFKGNFIDLGTSLDRDLFTLKMYPRDDGLPSFKYPDGRLLPLRGMISEQLMRAPDMLDSANEACLLVIKSGNATGVTIGRATGMESFVRDEETGQRSTEWAVYNYDSKSGVFSDKGDSGSMVADGLGRMGGMLNGGAGKAESSDITYFTPMCKLWPWVQAEFPHAHLYPETVA